MTNDVDTPAMASGYNNVLVSLRMTCIYLPTNYLFMIISLHQN